VAQAAGRTRRFVPSLDQASSRPRAGAFRPTLVTVASRQRIALIAHDSRKADLLEWSRYHQGTLARHELHATGTTGTLLANELGLEINRYHPASAGA
jgi:hypothetical protein